MENCAKDPQLKLLNASHNPVQVFESYLTSLLSLLIFIFYKHFSIKKLAVFGRSGRNGQNVQNHAKEVNKKEEEIKSEKLNLEEQNVLEMIENTKIVTKILVQVWFCFVSFPLWQNIDQW